MAAGSVNDMEALRQRLLGSGRNRILSSATGSVVANISNYLQSRVVYHYSSSRRSSAAAPNGAINFNATFPQCVVTWRDSPREQKQYTTITNNEQRWMYKTEFNLRYPEYKQLHVTITQFGDHFRRLVGTLQKKDPSSDDYKNYKGYIMRKYKVMKSNPDYRRTELRFYLLHRKLAHIKLLILEYDLKQMEAEE